MKLVKILFFLLFISSFGKAQIIVLDPGHGYGATTSDNPDGRTAIEIETSLEVGLRTRTLIQNSCTWTVQMTRTTNINGFVTLAQRVEMSNNWNADRFLSIHCNAGGGTGTETFYCTLNELYTADDVAFGLKIQADMVSYGQWANRRCVEDNTYLGYHLYVLRNTTATSCLNEIGFVDHAGDAAKLTNTAWRDNFANGYFNAFKSNLNLTCNVATPGPGGFNLTLTPECNGTTSQVRLNWTSSSNATSYDIYRNGSLYFGGVTGTQFINTSVTVGTSYSYQVRAKNTGGIVSNSNGTLAATAPVCTPPGAFTLTLTPECNVTKGQIRLNWTASANANSYDIYRNSFLYASLSPSTQFIDTVVNIGELHTYYVRAINLGGNTNNANGSLSGDIINAPNLWLGNLS
ncbi:MAG: N-acetylmuramoyl-L-alanine amidase, partial [Chitinophagaceae bacterium]